MKKKIMLGFAIVLVLSSSLLGCSGGRKNPLTLDEFKELFTTIEGELIELGEDTRTDKASAILLGRIHDMSITYYQMETEEVLVSCIPISVRNWTR